jgi:hypothetical protein
MSQSPRRADTGTARDNLHLLAVPSAQRGMPLFGRDPAAHDRLSYRRGPPGRTSHPADLAGGLRGSHHGDRVCDEGKPAVE